MLDPMDKSQSEIIAIKAMEWLASHDDELNRFLAQTGLTLEAARSELSNQDFLASTLDHVLSSENRLLAFCEAIEISPETPLKARQLLPGGDVPHWT